MAETTTQTPAERIREKIRQVKPGEITVSEAEELLIILKAWDPLVAAMTDLMAAPTVQDTVDRLVISTTPMVRSRAQAALRLALEHR